MCKTILVCAGQSRSNQLSWILRGQFLEAQAIFFTWKSVVGHSGQCWHIQISFWTLGSLLVCSGQAWAYSSILERTGTFWGATGSLGVPRLVLRPQVPSGILRSVRGQSCRLWRSQNSSREHRSTYDGCSEEYPGHSGLFWNAEISSRPLRAVLDQSDQF